MEVSLLQRAKMILPHLGLVALCVGYTMAGGAAFYWLERPYEEQRRSRGLQSVAERREELLAVLWNKSLQADVNE